MTETETEMMTEVLTHTRLGNVIVVAVAKTQKYQTFKQNLRKVS